MQRYSLFSLARNALGHHDGWQEAWRSPPPKPSYSVVIVGGGGHGLATAYYLAKEHGISDVAVLEKGWLGGGNTARNTTHVRSDYILDENAHFYEASVKLWEGLSADLNYNVMFSQRGMIRTGHFDSQVQALLRRGNGMRLNGIDAVFLSREEVRRLAPALDFSSTARFPITGAFFQPRAGNARHDAIAWGFARAADARGVDIIQNCEVTGFAIERGRVLGVETTCGFIRAEKVGLAVAGHTGHVAALAGLTLPIETHLLQAMVTEPVKPILDTVVSFGAGHFYTNQTDKGEIVMGGDLDGYNSYAQRGNLPMIEHVAAAAITALPCFGRLRIMRHWAGVMDMTMDGSPIIGKTPIDNLYLNGGWCYGGFKATPASGWCFAYTIAQDRPHSLNAPFNLDRFARGYTIDERGAGPYPGLH
jgi:heterotetrameric sarcosine oxidase beta subunit